MGWKNSKMVLAGRKAHLTRLRDQGRTEEAEEYLKQMSAERGAETLAGNISAQMAEEQPRRKPISVKYEVPLSFHLDPSLPWVEKHRPVSLMQLCGDVAPYLRAIVKKDSFPLALVFCGDYGEGKTAGAQAMIRDYYVLRQVFCPEATFKDILLGSKWRSDYEGCWPPVLYVDAAKTPQVDEIKSKVLMFMKVRAMWNPNAGKLKKFCIFDEADRLSYAAQGLLRALLEQYPGTVTVYTTNRIESIDPAIISRASGGVFEFKKPNKKQLVEHMRCILSLEKKQLPSKVLEEIAVNSASVREAVGKLQQEVIAKEADKP